VIQWSINAVYSSSSERHIDIVISWPNICFVVLFR